MKTYFKNFSDFISHVKMPGFATMMLSVIFIFLICIGIWGFLRIRNIQKGNLIITEYGLLNNEKETKPLFKLVKKRLYYYACYDFAICNSGFVQSRWFQDT